jgi:hypothetical protein
VFCQQARCRSSRRESYPFLSIASVGGSRRWRIHHTAALRSMPSNAGERHGRSRPQRAAGKSRMPRRC